MNTQSENEDEEYMDESSLIREIGELQATNSHLQKLCEEQRASEKELSDAYLRIRSLVGAWDTNHGGENRFEMTEKAVADLLAKIEEQRVEIDSLNKLVIANETAHRHYFRCAENCEKHVDELESQLAEQKGELEVERGISMSKNTELLEMSRKIEEQRVEIADRADTERSMAQAMLEDGEKIKELESQLAEKEKEKEKEIERLNRLLELTKNKWIEDTVKEGRVVLLQSQLATQTERVRVLEEALEKIADYPDEIASCAVAKQALNQESLGDGK